MVAVDTYIYFGGYHALGGLGGTNTELGAPESFWGIGRNMPKLNRVVPSGPDGINGGLYFPYWDGSYPNGTNVGARVAFHYMKNLIVPGANGDNWNFIGGGITPMSLLMQSLFDQYTNIAPGFRMLKRTAGGGVRAWQTGQPSWTALLSHYASLQAAEAGDGNTLLPKAVVIDTSDEDINGFTGSYLGPDLAYDTNMRNLIAQVRAQWGSDFPIVIVTPHPFTYKTSLPPVAPSIRTINEQIKRDLPNIVLFDMSWGQFAPAFKGGPIDSADPVYFQPETYLQAGVGIYNAIRQFYTAEPIADPTQPVAGFALFGDSQLVSIGVSPLSVFYGNQASLLGDDPLSTLLPNVWIWNETAEDVVQYDVLTNAAQFGSIWNAFGPELTLARAALARFPNGIFIFKYARASMSLTYASVVAGTQGGNFRGSTGKFETDVKPSFALARQVFANKFNRSLSMVGVLISLGENDLFTPETVAAFEEEAPLLIDEIRNFFTTDLSSTKPLPIVWVQGPVPFEDHKYGSILGSASRRRQYREAVANLPSIRTGVSALLAPNAKYEVVRLDRIHYGLEAVLDIGTDAAASFLALIDSAEGGTEVLEITGDLPSGSAAFIVETGSGVADANSLTTVEFADAYLRDYGNPQEWATSTATEKKDALRKMSRWLSFHPSWDGVRHTSIQGLAFPRHGLVDEDGYVVSASSVPTRIQQATAYGAYRIVKGDWNPFPDQDPDIGIASESITVGGISFSTSASGNLGTDRQSILALVQKLIRPFLKKRTPSLGRG